MYGIVYTKKNIHKVLKILFYYGHTRLFTFIPRVQPGARRSVSIHRRSSRDLAVSDRATLHPKSVWTSWCFVSWKTNNYI